MEPLQGMTPDQQNQSNQLNQPPVAGAPIAYSAPTVAAPVTPAPVASPAVGEFAASTATQTPMEVKRGHKLRWTVLAVVAVLLVAAGAFFGGYKTHASVVKDSQANASVQAKNFISAINDGNISSAYEMTSSNLQSKQTKSQFADSIKGLKSSNPSFTNEKTYFSGQKAIYSVVENGLAPAANGKTTGTFVIEMAQAGATGWQIDKVTVF